jgi:assimilatory nitrate reductase catalytic subunit
MCDVAQRMGFDGFGYDSSADIFGEHVALTSVLNNDTRTLDLSSIAQLNYDDLQPQQWGGSRPFGNGQFETPDGKARFVPTAALVVKPGEFTLNTGRVRDQWHTMTRTGLVPKLFGHRAEPYIEISPADARDLGLQGAELAIVNGSNGKSIVRVLVSDAVSKLEVFQPMHWSSTFASASKANASSVAVVDPVSGQPALKSAQITIQRFAAAWYGYGVTTNATQLPFDYWAVRPLSAGQSFECAGLAKTPDWHELLQGLVDFGDARLSIASIQTSSGAFRCVATRHGILEFAFFASDTPVEASRHWLQHLLGTAVVPSQILAGRPVAAQVDHGPIVCSCNGVGATQIRSAILAMPGASLNTICENTRAGMGCGSCRPEVSKLMGETVRFRQAAE